MQFQTSFFSADVSARFSLFKPSKIKFLSTFTNLRHHCCRKISTIIPNYHLYSVQVTPDNQFKMIHALAFELRELSNSTPSDSSDLYLWICNLASHAGQEKFKQIQAVCLICKFKVNR